MTDEPKKMLTLAEAVATVVAAAKKPLSLAGVKKGLEADGINTKKGGVGKAEILLALDNDGIHKHPPKKEGAMPEYWHKAPKSAEEIVAEAAAKAAAAQRKEDEKASKQAEAARKKVEKAAKALADAESKAAKDAEKAAKPLRELSEKVHAKVLQLGDKIVTGSGIGKPTAKAKPELHSAFERILGRLLEEKKLFEHPGGKYGRKAYEVPEPPKWYESKDAKGKIQKLIEAAKKVMAIDGATLEYVLPLIEQALGLSQKGQPTPEPSATPKETHQELSLPEFARKVMEIVHNAPSSDRFLDDGVYISAAYYSAKSTPGFHDLTIGEFKGKLLEANNQHLLNLSPIDLTRDADPEKLKESRTQTGYSTFDLINPK